MYRVSCDTLQRGWSKAETARVALKAGTGHVLSTLAIALVIWIGGVAFATRFGHWVDTIASVALIGFGAWIAIGAWRDLHSSGRHSHSHDHGHGHSHDHHEQPRPEKTKNRSALLLILGSSPMVEGIPAFFAASKHGVGLIIVMSAAFAATTIGTYILLCVYSTAGLQRVSLGPVERYGEVLSGAFIALVGLAFWLWPVL
jgi:ABC-type nickel/cobalt efflux system permease component RcnA